MQRKWTLNSLSSDTWCFSWDEADVFHWGEFPSVSLSAVCVCDQIHCDICGPEPKNKQMIQSTICMMKISLCHSILCVFLLLCAFVHVMEGSRCDWVSMTARCPVTSGDILIHWSAGSARSEVIIHHLMQAPINVTILPTLVQTNTHIFRGQGTSAASWHCYKSDLFLVGPCFPPLFTS